MHQLLPTLCNGTHSGHSGPKLFLTRNHHPPRRTVSATIFGFADGPLVSRTCERAEKELLLERIVDISGVWRQAMSYKCGLCQPWVARPGARERLLSSSRMTTRTLRLVHKLVLLSGGHHPGIFVIRRDNDPTRTMSPRAIVGTIHKLATQHYQFRMQFMSSTTGAKRRGIPPAALSGRGVDRGRVVVQFCFPTEGDF